MGAKAVTEEEHVSFLVMWLCKYLFCNSSITMIEQCTKLAFALAAGRKIALALFVLSILYHGCNDIVMGKFDDARGPFWILQFWLHGYFPEHQPLISNDGNAPTYGYALAKGVLRPKTFNQYILFFHKCPSRTANQFTPFTSMKFGPEWFKRSFDPYFQKLNRTELKDIWASYLTGRELPYSILLDESSKCKCRVEHYSPNQFARQFGMTQAIPLHQSANNISIKRENFLSAYYIEETGSRFCQLRRKFIFVPFDANPSSTEFFNSWWSGYIETRDKTANDFLRKISPCVMALSPSDREEVAAPRSIGIKGNPRSAGKFGQNVKRKYKEVSVLSQSLVEQDEPRQQRNSHEGSERISTMTLCKKMKTSAREMPLPGTTSAIPFASACLTSCAPANDARVKVDVQVSADDEPISTSSSSPDKDDEKCRVSPSLPETTSKASDISEPPACPVKFDNLEDFFARVSGQTKRAQFLTFSTDQSSSIYGSKMSAKQKSPPSAEMLATAKDDIERLLMMPSQDLLLPENCSTLSEALSVYAESPDLSVERALALEKLVENLPYLSSNFCRAKEDQEQYYKIAAKKLLLIDELTKGQEHYSSLKDHNDKLKCTIRKLKANLKDAEEKRKAIQEQKLRLAKKCFEKSTALDEMEAEFHGLAEMKELADSDIAQVETSLRDFKSKIIK